MSAFGHSDTRTLWYGEGAGCLFKRQSAKWALIMNDNDRKSNAIMFPNKWPSIDKRMVCIWMEETERWQGSLILCKRAFYHQTRGRLEVGFWVIWRVDWESDFQWLIISWISQPKANKKAHLSIWQLWALTIWVMLYYWAKIKSPRFLIIIILSYAFVFQ